MSAPNQQSTTEAQTPEEAADLLRSLREGDRVQFGGDEWKVISEAEEDFNAVEFRSLSGYHPGTTTLKPSSGYQSSAVVTHSRGMGSHYGSLTVTARDLEAHQPEDDGDDGAPQDSAFQGEETTELGADLSDLTARLSEDEDEEDEEPVLMTDGGTVQSPETFQFSSEEDAEDVDLTFTVTDSWENRYGDQKAAIQTPAPWDVPDDAEVSADPNELVKELEWDDHHYTFDKDREAWTVDVSGLKPLAELAQEAGYEWEGRARSEEDDEESEAQATLRALAEAAREGDRIKVQYAKKNGNGLNTYKGEVEVAQVGQDGDPDADWDSRRRRTTSTGIVFTDENGKTKRVKEDDDGTPALFSSGYHPFMGVLTEVTLIR